MPLHSTFTPCYVTSKCNPDMCSVRAYGPWISIGADQQDTAFRYSDSTHGDKGHKHIGRRHAQRHARLHIGLGSMIDLLFGTWVLFSGPLPCHPVFFHRHPQRTKGRHKPALSQCESRAARGISLSASAERMRYLVRLLPREVARSLEPTNFAPRATLDYSRVRSVGPFS